ncbi:hypothetical protein HYV49_02405 [Candidatus Pacearchaeota archaeon]|nr:hypothetical protein [Candidatus Pacearchaeota archaeon]
MVSREEFLPVIISILLLGVILGLRDLGSIPILILFAAIVIAVNIAAKELVAYFLDAGLSINFWYFQRYGFRRHEQLKKPFPVGLIAPIATALVTFGYFVWMAILQYDVYALKSRVSKRFGPYKFSEMTDFHVGLIGAFGIIANLLIAFIAYIIGFEELALISLYYSFFNLIPISNLDGTKIFFGNMILWFVLAILTIISILFSWVVV